LHFCSACWQWISQASASSPSTGAWARQKHEPRLSSFDRRGFGCPRRQPQRGDDDHTVHQERGHSWESPAAEGERSSLAYREDPRRLRGSCRSGADHPSRLNPGADRFAGLEEGGARKGADSPRYDDRINRIAGNPGSSCDLFDGKDVSENRHRA
jgi:hypothetical protein